MGEVVQLRKPQPKPTLQELVARVRKIMEENPDAVGFDHPHLQERMSTRGKHMREILEVLKKGEGVKGPDLDKYGDYRIKLRRFCCGRTTNVVVAIREKDLTVITVT